MGDVYESASVRRAKATALATTSPDGDAPPSACYAVGSSSGGWQWVIWTCDDDARGTRITQATPAPFAAGILATKALAVAAAMAIAPRAKRVEAMRASWHLHIMVEREDAKAFAAKHRVPDDLDARAVERNMQLAEWVAQTDGRDDERAFSLDLVDDVTFARLVDRVQAAARRRERSEPAKPENVIVFSDWRAKNQQEAP